MTIDLERAAKPLRKLRKILKDFPAHPTPDQVHGLRTRARRLEAVVHTVSPDPDREARRLLKVMKPLRKAAGQVRDVDVFIAKLYSLSNGEAGEGLVRLTEQLAEMRQKHAARLCDAVGQKQKEARRCIRGYLRRLEKGTAGSASPAAPQVLATELEHWPKLHAENLHEFRVRAKELRYMLQLTDGVDQERMDALAEVKELAGEWHDWLELRAIAEEILDPEADRAVLKQIAGTTREKLRSALTAANRLRKLTVEVPRAA